MPTPLPSDIFARRLRTERERRKISQAELARRMAQVLDSNVDPSAVTRIEQQTRAVRLDEAVAVAAVLDVPIAALLADPDADRNEALKQQYLAELAAAYRRWEETRQEIGRLTGLIQSLSMDQSGIHDPAGGEKGTGS
ncbi:helix-turn-helix domain-containing protein [Arthrobacter sp. GN70]|uniref:Helix-turn-helix domain-containing protein n=2 Tax=Arthrobacter TaxID=1663 RepID=A0A4R5K8P7_9MICC|nr:helix-turn-helix domain-containing protein [Arthrobacter sp. GN70]TDF90550.1 helix-turn-helix domain-containing protein [Arthrobacter terricola]